MRPGRESVLASIMIFSTVSKTVNETYMIIAKLLNQWFESICHVLRSVRVDNQDSDLGNGRACHRCAALVKLRSLELEIQRCGAAQVKFVGLEWP